jgi:hypothetical protein
VDYGSAEEDEDDKAEAATRREHADRPLVGQRESKSEREVGKWMEL